MDNTAELLRELARAKVAFQHRTIEMVIRGGVLPTQEEFAGGRVVSQLDWSETGLSLPNRGPP